MIEKIQKRIEPLIHASGLDLEEIEMTPAGRRTILRVIIDGDAVSLDDVAAVSREISALIDTDPIFGEKAMTLEVTSRGVDRPLTLPRHWRRNHDRLVAISRADGQQITGRIKSSDDLGATLDVNGKEVSIPFTDVKKAKIEIEFNRKDGE